MQAENTQTSNLYRDLAAHTLKLGVYMEVHSKI